MALHRNRVGMDHPVVITFLIFAIIAFMYFAGEVLKPLALAGLLCLALSPLVRFLERRGLPRVAAVLLTVVLALGAIGGVGYVVGRNLYSLAANLPEYQKNIENKIHENPYFQPGEQSVATRVTEAANQIATDLAGVPVKRADIQRVEVVSRPSFQDRLEMMIGPLMEPLAVGSIILILVLFILINREDLTDRIIQLFGSSRLSLTTRTMEEVGRRIGRYLATFAVVNSVFGLIVGLGLWAGGVQYPALWGTMAAALRFIPYVGPAIAFTIPLIFSFAMPNSTWVQPFSVVATFGILEVLANSFLEPIIYGKTTGVSALGLLVAAMFWTWLWGPLGLLLSTPLTVCLAVLGKYVSSLSFFATLLGEEAELDQHVRYYQRLLALDQDGASEVVEEALSQQPRAEVCDTILIPALSHAERDRARDEIDDREQEFIWRVTGDLVVELEGTTPFLHVSPATPDSSSPLPEPAAPPSGPIRILGLPSNDSSDALVLRMLETTLDEDRCQLEILTDASAPLKVAEAIAEREPDLVLISHLPPVGLTPARYLVRRLRARFPNLPIWVGRWGEGGAEAAAQRLNSAGSTRVVFGLSEARDLLMNLSPPQRNPPTPATTGAPSS